MEEKKVKLTKYGWFKLFYLVVGITLILSGYYTMITSYTTVDINGILFCVSVFFYRDVYLNKMHIAHEKEI